MRFIWVLLFTHLTSCGYNWGHTSRQLPEGARTVFVEIFKNLTVEPGVEHNFTQSLTQELERSGFAVVSSKDAAELVIKGQLVNINQQGSGSRPGFYNQDFTSGTTQAYTASFNTFYYLTVTANISAYRSRDKQLVWQTSITGGQLYRGANLKTQGIRSSNVLYNQSRKKQTMKLIAKTMMGEAFDRLTENF